MVDHFEIIRGEILICLLHFTFMIISLSNNFNIVIPLDVYLHYSFEKMVDTFFLMLLFNILILAMQVYVNVNIKITL